MSDSELTAKAERQRAFLVAYLECGANREAAASKAAVPMSTVYRWMNEPEFGDRMRETFGQFEQPLLEEAIRRALTKSDLLMIFLLKSINPTRYDDGVRKQNIANTALMDANRSQVFTAEQIRDLIINDPAQEFIPRELET